MQSSTRYGACVGVALLVAAAACGGSGTVATGTSSGTGGETATSSGGAGGIGGATTTSTSSTGGTGGVGGMGPGAHGPHAGDVVSAGDVCSSPSYRMVFTMGQPTQNQTKTTSPSYRMQGGLIGATGTLP